MEEIIQLITLEQEQAAQKNRQRSKKRPSFRMRAGGVTPLGNKMAPAAEKPDCDFKDLADETTSTETNNDSFSSVVCNVDDDSNPESKNATGAVATSTTTSSRRVSFNEVHVREYEQVLSYNPACSDGAALEIGWHYNHEEHRSVDEFELERPPPTELLPLSRRERAAILERQGYTAFDLAASEREIRVIQLNRMKTIRKLIKEEQKEERKVNKKLKLRGFPFFRKQRQRPTVI